MLSLTELRVLQKRLSPTCACYLVQAMKTLSLSSLRYNALVIEISEAYSKAGIETPMEMQLALSGSLRGQALETLWELLKQASASTTLAEYPTIGLDRDEAIRQLSYHINILRVSVTAMGRQMPVLGGIPPSIDV